MKRKKIIPKRILENLPVKFFFLDEINSANASRVLITRTYENKYYDSSMLDCKGNYRKTSKIICND